MHITFIIDYIHHLINEFKMLIFTSNNDWKMYIVRENYCAYFVIFLLIIFFVICDSLTCSQEKKIDF